MNDKRADSFNAVWTVRGEPSDAISSRPAAKPSAELIDGKFVKSHGIHWVVASFFIIADMAGAGIVALPAAAEQCSNFYLGLFLCYLMAPLAAITAILLSRCWDILPAQWSEYREQHCRKPYGEIGFRALGPVARTLVSINLNISLFGISVVFLLLSSQTIHDFVRNLTQNSPDVCIVILVVGLVLLPFTFLKSPENFWMVIVVGMLCTGVAILLLVIGAGIDYNNRGDMHREPPKFDKMNLFSAIGTFLFTFAGHSAFPSIQHDMRRPSEFKKSIVLAFILICVSYAPVMMLAHFAYGSATNVNVIGSIGTLWIQQTVNLLIAFHCMLTLILMINPLNQEAEEAFKVPQEFGIRRVILRTAMLVAVVVFAEAIPSFGPVLSLMGSTTMTLMFLVFPCIFYLFLTANIAESKRLQRPPERVSFRQMVALSDKPTLALCTGLILFGLVGGSVATYSAYVDITDTHFQMPCFVKPFIHRK